MKIESNFKDYYDMGLVYGIDEKVYFKRTQKKFKVSVSFPGGSFKLHEKENFYKINVNPYIIGLCGEFYPLYHVKIEKNFRGKLTFQEDFLYSYGYGDNRTQEYLVIYPILKEYKFSKIKGAYDVFQEVSMFLGNTYSQEDNMIQCDDKNIAFSKGFCCHSFRKKPKKRSMKKCGKKLELE